METKIDPRVLDILKQAEPHALKRHRSRRQWALSVPMEPTQLSAAFSGRAGISPARMLDLVEQAGVVLKIAEATAEHPTLVGELTAGGWISAKAAPSLPAVIEVVDPFLDCKPGDRVVVVSGAFELDTWVLVQHPDGALRLHLCATKGKMKTLETEVGEVTFYDPKLHTISGRVAYRQIAFAGRRK